MVGFFSVYAPISLIPFSTSPKEQGFFLTVSGNFQASNKEFESQQGIRI